MKKQKNYFQLIIFINILILIILISISCAARSNEDSNKDNKSLDKGKDQDPVSESFEFGEDQLKYPPGMSVSLEGKKTFIGQGTSSWVVDLGNGKFQSIESDSEGPINMTKDGSYTIKAKALDEIYMNFEHEIKAVTVNIFHSYSVIEPVEINKSASFTIPEGFSELVYEILVTYEQGTVHYAFRVIIDEASDTDKITLEDLRHKHEYEWMTRQVGDIDPSTRKFGVIETPLKDFDIINSSNNSPVNFGGIKHDYYVYDLYYGVAQVYNGDKYGYVNAKGQELTPIIFDELNPGYLDNERVSENVKYNNRYLHIDLLEGIVSEYLPYEESMVDQYSDVIDLDFYEIVIVDGRIVVNGVTDDLGYRFPVILLDGLEFDLYQDSEFLGSYIGNITRGDYEGDLNISFDNGSKSYGYTATLGVGPNNEFEYETYTSIEEMAKYEPIIQDILEESNIGNSAISISSVYQGDFLGNGRQSAIVKVKDDYHRYENLDTMYDEWNEEDFTSNEFALFDMILFIEDVNDVSNYNIIYFDYYQYLTKLAYPSITISDFMNINHEPDIEVILDMFWYEYGEYSVLNLN